MKLRILFLTLVVTLHCILLAMSAPADSSHPRRQKQFLEQSHKNHRSSGVSPTHDNVNTDSGTYHSNHIRRSKHHQTRGHRSEESSEEDDNGRHAYVMTTDHLKPESHEDEDQTLTLAFQNHMNPTNQQFKKPHDIYAYKLPSDLWFIVSYKKNSEGKTDKYMNIVSSFTNYLDKLDTSTKSVSVNVKGVETVFRLTSKFKS